MPRTTQLANAYDLFASCRDIGVCCAVRRDRSKPKFLADGTWEFRGCVVDEAQAPVDLNLRVANASIDLTGHHLFVALRTRAMGPLPVQRPERIITVGEIIPYIMILYGLTIVIALLA